MDVSLSLLVIRFAAGMLLMGHGAQKLVGIGGGPGLQTWTANVEKMGFRPAALWGAASVAAEFIGGIALAIGFFTPLVAALLVGQLFVAIAKVHWPKGLWVQGGGYEYPFLLAVIVAVVGLGGPGRYSVDAALGWDLVSGVIFVPLAALAIIVNALMIRATPAPAAPRREERQPAEARRRAA
ncbi:MAG TPA: DoxX family protein [Candidatus Limnocylindria bacterium]|nr:DoxX family protein [Candidatus Limnocylindria bacterium]